MTARALTADQANAIWDVLVKHAGAHEHARDDFARLNTTDYPGRGTAVHHFPGRLYPAGMSFCNSGDRWWIVADPDQAFRVRTAIDTTNAALETLHKEMTA